MLNTKQFTIFFLLVVVFLVAIMIVTSLAQRESTRLYDTTTVRTLLSNLVNISATKIQAQEVVMDNWIDEVEVELQDAHNQVTQFQAEIDAAINP